MKKNSYELIEKALALLGQRKPNIMFFAADVKTEYLMFYKCDYSEVEEIENQLEELGVTFVAKYECLGVERLNLWDYTFNE